MFILIAAIVGLVLGIIYCFVDYNDNYILNGLCGLVLGAAAAAFVSMIITIICWGANVEKEYKLEGTYELSQINEEEVVYYIIEKNDYIFYNVCDNEFGKASIHSENVSNCDFIISDELKIEKYRIYPKNKILRFLTLFPDDYCRIYIPEGTKITFKK